MRGIRIFLDNVRFRDIPGRKIILFAAEGQKSLCISGGLFIFSVIFRFYRRAHFLINFKSFGDGYLPGYGIMILINHILGNI